MQALFFCSPSDTCASESMRTRTGADLCPLAHLHENPFKGMCPKARRFPWIVMTPCQVSLQLPITDKLLSNNVNTTIRFTFFVSLQPQVMT